MLGHVSCARIDSVPLRCPPISRNTDERAIRFELERQACQSLRQVLQLKLQQRRSREELVKQGIMPSLKGSAAFHEQRRSLERARTEDYLKRKIKSRPERSELISMHILEETAAEPSVRAKQLQLKRARLADDLNGKISQRPGPMELIHKNILPVHCSIKRAFIEKHFPKASDENSSCDEESSCSLSPEPSVNRESPLGLLPLPSPPETPTGSSAPSPTQLPPTADPFPPITGSSPSLKLTNGTAAPSIPRTGAVSQIKYQLKPNSDRFAQKHKKPKDNKPKIKKLKYHQYIPPDQKEDKDPPPHLDSSYAKVLQQQQLFLQLQILSQQQQHYNYHTILPAPPKPLTDQQPSSSSSSSVTTCSTPRPVTARSVALSIQGSHSCQSSFPLGSTKPVSLPPNLDEMKVAELKSELKRRTLPVSGTKTNLIERLRIYQELNGGADTTSSPTAGGTAGPGAGGAGKSTEGAASTANNNHASQQPQQQHQFQCHQISSFSGTAEVGSATLAAGTPQQPMTSGGTTSPPTISLTHSDHLKDTVGPEDTSFDSDPSEQMINSPLTQLSLQPSSASQLLVKEELECSTLAPNQFVLKTAPSQKHGQVSSTSCTAATTARVLTVDKDKMLQEKDKQIEELTRLLRQKQRLVEVLRMQLERGKSRGRAPESLVPVKVKQEPSEKTSGCQSLDHSPIPHLPSSCEMDVSMVTVKQETIEAEEVVCQTAEQKSPQTKQQHICLQFVQGQAIQKLLLEQQNNIQNQQRTIQSCNQTVIQQNLQNLSQQRKRKSHKQQQLEHQSLLNHQRSFLQEQNRLQHQTRQQHQIQFHTKIHLKQQQVLIQQRQPVQQTAPQGSQSHLNQPSAPALPLDLLKSASTPALVTDNNGNHFLIALTSHITENQSTDAPESKATNEIPLQNGGLEVRVGQPQQEALQCLSTPASLQPFFMDQKGKHTTAPFAQAEVCPRLDMLFSPPSPASIKSAASSTHYKETEDGDDFIDIILQTGEMSTTFNSAWGPSLDHLNPASSPPPSPLQLSPTPPVPPTPRMAPAVQYELHCLADPTEDNQHLSYAGSGRLEDFLESTTGKPLLGVEPGGLLTLIDDLHSQMLCTPSILDHPPSPMDTSNLAEEGDHELNSMDWLDLGMGDVRGAETPSLGPLGPQTPPSVFSTDFLDAYDLQTHWNI